MTVAMLTLISCSDDETVPAAAESHEEGLEIVGTRTVAGSRVTGALDLELLERDLVSACHAELQATIPAAMGSTTAKYVDPGGCSGDETMLQINLCLGHKYMEIADAVSVFTIAPRQLRTDSQGRLLRSKPGASVSYEIPPQSAANRTLVYRLASQAFAAAGERGVSLIGTPDCLNGTNGIMGTITQSDPAKNRAEIFTVGFGDAVQSFSEATEKLVANQVRVGDTKGQEVRGYSESRESLWNDTENSRRAAVATIASVDTPDLAPIRLPAGTVPADSDGVEKAIDFFRSEPVAAILDPDASDEAVLAAAQAAFAEDFPLLYDPYEDAEAFLSRFGLRTADLVQARRYLVEEHRIFKRTRLETTPGSGRIAGLASPPVPLPAAATFAGTVGSRPLPSTSVSDPAYRASGALQMLDYLRWGARKALRQGAGDSSLLPAPLRPLFSAAAMIGESEVGHMRLEVTRSGAVGGEIPVDGNLDVRPLGALTVRIHGVGDDADPQRFVLVRSMDGARCVVDGKIEGVECNPSDYILADTGETQDGDQYDQQMDGTVTIQLPLGGDDEEVYVVDLGGDGGGDEDHLDPRVMVGVDPTATDDGGLLAPVNANAFAMGDDAAQSPEDHGVAKVGCAGLPHDLVVPLESEITEDNDPYENSWRHYLDLADQMAREADALGEELIRAGLEGDMRGEAARDELEDYCGGVINVGAGITGTQDGTGEPEEILSDEAQLLDPSLETCLPRLDGEDIEVVRRHGRPASEGTPPPADDGRHASTVRRLRA